MRKCSYLVFVVLLFFTNCSSDNPVTANYLSRYFPLRVGNTWYYDSPTPQTNPWAMTTIESSFIKNNSRFYTWKYGKGVDIIDSIRVDGQGNIWKLVNGKECLWFDFTKDSGSSYIFNPPDSSVDSRYYTNVYVRKNISVETPAGVFDNCISFAFDVYQFKDEERYYTFAPNIGPVRIASAWTDQKLTAAVIDGIILGN